MIKLMTFVITIAVLFASHKAIPLAVRRNWLLIALFGRLQKVYGKTIYISPSGMRAEVDSRNMVTVYFSPYKRLMNGLALVLVALVDWLGFFMLLALFLSILGIRYN